MKKIMLILTLLLFTFTLTGCDLLYLYVRSDIEAIAIDSDSVEPYYYIDDFDIASITLLLYLEDDTITSTPLSRNMIHDEDLFYLETFGTHTIRIKFRNFETTLLITLYERESLKEKETFLFL